MKELAPVELLDQFRGEVALIAAGSDDQVRWLRSAEVPVDEIWLQFKDGVLVFIPRLRHEGLMTPELEAALRTLDDYFSSLEGLARSTEDALRSDRAWEEARRQATAILLMIDAVAAASRRTR